jgi:hypothetical protein
MRPGERLQLSARTPARRTMPKRPRSPHIFVFVLLGFGCSASPTNDTLGWNGRGMPLPTETGAAGNLASGAAGSADTAPGTGGAGTGAAGAGTGAAGTGAAGTSSPTGTGAGGSAAGAGALAGSGGSTGAAGAGNNGTAGNGVGGGAAGAPADAGTPPMGGTPLGATCRLDVVVTTHSGGGNHAPKNVDAIWIQDASGTFLKSLYVMARNEIQHLNAWNAATTAAGLSRNRVDAVTGASLPGYGTRMATWNCTDVSEKVVTSGGYQVCFDLNDGNGTDKHTCDNITLGRTATTVMPPDALPCFTGRVLTYTP